MQTYRVVVYEDAPAWVELEVRAQSPADACKRALMMADDGATFTRPDDPGPLFVGFLNNADGDELPVPVEFAEKRGLHLSNREIETIIAALRAYQGDSFGPVMDNTGKDLSDDEIDTLCDRLNA
mgnify:CR=1 FL=1